MLNVGVFMSGMAVLRTQKPESVFASAFLFPVAAVYAALILPWSMLVLLWQIPAPPGLYSVYAHAHELLAGYALLVIAGYLLGKVKRRQIYVLLMGWVAARITFLCWPGSLAAVLSTLFTVCLVGYWVVPRFAKSAKKWRNKVVAPLLMFLLALLVVVSFSQWVGRTVLVELLLGLCLLMFFMGGRVLAPAVAGYLIRQQIPMPHRVQPSIEGAVIVLLLLALLCYPLPWTWSSSVAGALLIAAGVLSGVRIFRWQLWRCGERLDLLLLALGYSWLALGMLTLGVALIGCEGLTTAAIHCITVGALGTLSAAIMSRTHLMRRTRDPNGSVIAHWGVGLISLAAGLRLIVALVSVPSNGWLLLAALFWSAGFLCLLAMFAQPMKARENKV